MTEPGRVAARYVPTNSLWTTRDTRQRRTINTAGLIDSIRDRGILQPLVVSAEPGPENQPFRLIAGERRWTCAVELGLPEVPAVMLQDLDPLEAQIIELEENLKRLDLTWQEQASAIAAIHQVYLERDQDWTQTKTAASIHVTVGWVSRNLMVANALVDEAPQNDRIREAGTVNEAYNVLLRREQRLGSEALAEMLEADEFVAAARPEAATVPVTGTTTGVLSVPATPAPRPVPLTNTTNRDILHESFLHWAPKYSGRQFNLIHCDFPYGVGLFNSNGTTAGANRSQMGRDAGEAYTDTSDTYFRLLHCLCDNFNKLMSLSGHLMFWFSEKHRDETMRVFREKVPSLVWQPFPLIWFKSDNAGIAADVRRGPRHVYETCLMATRGERHVVKVVADCYPAPTDKTLHVSAKPVGMLKHFMSMLVDEHTRLLDPTCGSGNALRAAEALGATQVFGMDIDEITVGRARLALRQDRGLRQSSMGVPE